MPRPRPPAPSPSALSLPASRRPGWGKCPPAQGAAAPREHGRSYKGFGGPSISRPQSQRRDERDRRPGRRTPFDWPWLLCPWGHAQELGRIGLGLHIVRKLVVAMG